MDKEFYKKAETRRGTLRNEQLSTATSPRRVDFKRTPAYRLGKNRKGFGMPTLEFKGKASVYSHHLSVPFRELIVDKDKSLPAHGKEPSLDDNLIIHGDNLEALKALLPRYAGKVDVIYIDPPYNTGSEGWAYNDNVNSPLMKLWLGKTVDAEDLERHDKWLCMMWPRLELLKELLAPSGLIFVSIDDEEGHRCRYLLDEIFGLNNFVATLVWQKRYVSNVTAQFISDMHDFIHVYAVDRGEIEIGQWSRTEEQLKAYQNPDDDPRGRWRAQDLSASKPYKAGVFTIDGPKGGQFDPPPNRYWRMNRQQFQKWQADNRIWWGKDGTARPMLKAFLDESEREITPNTWWDYNFAGHNKEATLELKTIFDGAAPFDTPKPSKLIGRILELATTTREDALILDSFAGSGTTAHAVLAANQKDGGNRKFILVETEGYADSLTAERVRRVINGVPGAKEEALKNGLGGSFTYCELGEPLDLERFFKGETTPPYQQVARYIVYTATGLSIEDVPEKPDDLWFVGEVGGYRIHLIYKPDIAWMKSGDAALSAELADHIAKAAGKKPVLVYAAQKFMGQKSLKEQGITFCHLPYSIYRILGDGSDAA